MQYHHLHESAFLSGEAVRVCSWNLATAHSRQDFFMLVPEPLKFRKPVLWLVSPAQSQYSNSFQCHGSLGHLDAGALLVADVSFVEGN